MSILSFSMFSESEDSDSLIKVVFLDGSSQEVQNCNFIYEWFYKSDFNYINPTHYKKKSEDFHYKAMVRSVEIDKSISWEKISKINFIWPKDIKSFTKPDEIHIKLTSGEVVTLQEREELNVTSTFLQGKSADEIDNPSYLNELFIEGTAVVEGQKGRFSSRLYCLWKCGFKETSETIKEIVVLPTE